MGARAKRIGVEADARADAARLLPPVAEAQHERAVGEARHAQDRQLEAAAGQLQLDQVLVLQAQRGRGRGAHEQGVVPGDLGDRVRQLLEPGVVGAGAVFELGARLEHDLQRARARRLRGGGERREGSRLQLEPDARQRALGQHAVVQHPVPALVEVGSPRKGRHVD